MSRLLLILFLISGPAFSQHAGENNENRRVQNGGAVIVYSKGGAFLIAGPKGWTADSETGKRLGLCCVYYPEGVTWNTAETVLYPNIATKGTGQKTLKEFMDHDLADFREHNPGMTYDAADDIPLKNKRAAKLRYFYGVNNGSSEAIAYIDEEKIISLVVVSSKTIKGLNDAMPLLRDVLQTYAYMDVKSGDGAKPANASSLQLPRN